ncbi:unnamed protein product [Prunus armeniaca]
MLSHYVDDLEGHDRIKSELDHIGTHALLKMLAPVANAVVTSLEKHSSPEADKYGTIVRVGEPIRRDFVIINLYSSLKVVERLDESIQQFAVIIMSQVVHLCILLFWWKLMHKGNVVSHYVDDLEGHDRIESALAHEVEEAFAFWGTAEGDPVHPAECMQQKLEKVRRHRVNVDGNVRAMQHLQTCSGYILGNHLNSQLSCNILTRT